MTEDEAKTKWCPMLDRDSEDHTCLVSGCMAWVHERSVWCNPDGSEPTPEQKAARTPEESGLITVTFGHCGMVKER